MSFVIIKLQSCTIKTGKKFINCAKEHFCYSLGLLISSTFNRFEQKWRAVYVKCVCVWCSFVYIPLVCTTSRVCGFFSLFFFFIVVLVFFFIIIFLSILRTCSAVEKQRELIALHQAGSEEGPPVLSEVL